MLEVKQLPMGRSLHYCNPVLWKIKVFWQLADKFGMASILDFLQILTIETREQYLANKDRKVNLPLKKAVGSQFIAEENDVYREGDDRLTTRKDAAEILLEKPEVFSEANSAKILILKPLPTEPLMVEKEVIHKDHMPTQRTERDRGGGQLESLGILSRDKMKEIELEKRKQALMNEETQTVFLLKERLKSSKNAYKLTVQTAFKKYKNQAEQEFYDVNLDDLENESSEQDSLKGILLNKRQY